ncbi:MAG: hypothetical protein ACYS67_10370, partial [Planctomycetota bacterium]
MKNATKVMMASMVLVVGLVCSSAYGQAENAGSDKWELSVTPYFWFAGIEGDMKVRENKVDIDVGFSDVW